MMYMIINDLSLLFLQLHFSIPMALEAQLCLSTSLSLFLPSLPASVVCPVSSTRITLYPLHKASYSFSFRNLLLIGQIQVRCSAPHGIMGSVVPGTVCFRKVTAFFPVPNDFKTPLTDHFLWKSNSGQFEYKAKLIPWQFQVTPPICATSKRYVCIFTSLQRSLCMQYWIKM